MLSGIVRQDRGRFGDGVRAEPRKRRNSAWPLPDLRQGNATPIVPVYCGALDNGAKPRVRVVFGAAVREGTSLADIRQEIRQLGEWVRANDGMAEAAH